MAAERFADIGLVRFSWGTRPVGAGFIVDDRHIVTCAHVVNASLGRALIAAERPDTVGPVAARPLTGHTRAVTSVAVGELDDSPIVVSGGEDAKVHSWRSFSPTASVAPLRGSRTRDLRRRSDRRSTTLSPAATAVVHEASPAGADDPPMPSSHPGPTAFPDGRRQHPPRSPMRSAPGGPKGTTHHRLPSQYSGRSSSPAPRGPASQKAVKVLTGLDRGFVEPLGAVEK